MIARIPTLLLLFAAAVLLAAGCGGDSGSNSDGASNDDATEEPAAEDTGSASNDEAGAPEGGLELGVEGNELEFDTEELTAKAGSVTLTLNNTSTIQHNIAIETEDGEELGAGELVGKGETSTVTADLEPGTYTYYCSPHKSSGMTGTLTVS